MVYSKLFFLILLTPYMLAAACDFRVGPDFSYLTRTRSGGTEQKGLLAGVTAVAERRKRCGIYVAVEGSYSAGILRGNTSLEQDLDSRYDEGQIEGRLGFTAHSCHFKYFDTTPFVGYGNLYAKNTLQAPSPVIATFHDEYPYYSAGLLTRFALNRSFSMAVNFSAQYSLEGTSRITNDPLFEDQELLMGEVLQYEVDIPVRYVGCFCGRPCTSTIALFYKNRCYGKRDNFPFDFFETRLTFYGLRWELGTYF